MFFSLLFLSAGLAYSFPRQGCNPPGPYPECCCIEGSAPFDPPNQFELDCTALECAGCGAMAGQTIDGPVQDATCNWIDDPEVICHSRKPIFWGALFYCYEDLCPQGGADCYVLGDIAGGAEYAKCNFASDICASGGN